MARDEQPVSMPVISAVAEREQLVAQGCYYYYRNAEKMPVLEPWTIHRLDDSLRIRSFRDAGSFGNQILVHSVQTGDAITRFQVQWNKIEGESVKTVFADYEINEGKLKVSRTGIDGEQETLIEELQTGCVISPLMRIYNGGVIRQLLAAGKSQVLVPWIRDPDDTTRLLEPLLSEREAHLRREEEITIAGTTYRARCYEYFGGEYQPGTLFWLDEHDVMLRYRWQQDENTVWETNLEDYRR